MRTARLTVLLEPTAKSAIEARAAELNLSASELVRRAVDVYDPEADPAALAAISAELAETVSRVEAKLDALGALFDRTGKREAERAAFRETVRAELAASGAVWPFDP